MKAGVKAYCHIRENTIYQNGITVYSAEKSLDFKSFLKSASKNIELKYPKFYKMDEISKLGLLAAEVLTRMVDRKAFDDKDIGMVLSNAQSTIVTDSLHQDSINDKNNYYPSPSIFVYTLPNIMIGEISIKHKFRGENAFFIFEHFNSEFVADYINLLFKDKKIKACIGGWVDQSKNSYDAFVYWTDIFTNHKDIAEHTGEELKRLYELNYERHGRTD